MTISDSQYNLIDTFLSPLPFPHPPLHHPPTTHTLMPPSIPPPHIPINHLPMLLLRGIHRPTLHIRHESIYRTQVTQIDRCFAAVGTGDEGGGDVADGLDAAVWANLWHFFVVVVFCSWGRGT
ncbi:hypothetical protein ONS95_007470 [Cadophora gregata]|uniref:uncharacterized protein n=1 Tax=Cadophora gregata TaxID=51156 RepID=UPI0026DD8C28|nr:uncharacterized protein ONS95_007470 [Cadophora gregata]KAK0125839.1 hypothetical protein ONS95_007470 [Cadophora gregata]